MLDPPPLLAQVCVVLVSPKLPVSVGTVARALSCFECTDLRIVQPRCDPLVRSARNASKGAQFLLYRAAQHASLQAAVADCHLSVAFARWASATPAQLRLGSLPQLTDHPVMQQLLAAHGVTTGGAAAHDGDTAAGAVSTGGMGTASPAGSADGMGSTGSASASGSTGSPGSTDSATGSSGSTGTTGGGPAAVRTGTAGSTGTSGGGPAVVRVALVFGREEAGLTDSEVAACDAVCSIPIGRLQESLSLSHAVALPLSHIFGRRLAAQPPEVRALYQAQGAGDLAVGWADVGAER